LKNLQNVFLSFVFTIIVFGINFIVPSQINGFHENGFNLNFNNLINTSYAETIFNVRYDNPVFGRRPIILESQKFLNEYLNVPFQFSFNLLNFVLLFCLFLILSKCDFKTRKADPKILKFAFLFSIPILFAFFGSMCTYDDLGQYLFLLLFLIFLFKEKHLISIFFFVLACITRETSFIFYIVIIPFLLFEAKTNKAIKIISWVLPIILYLGFLTLYLSNEHINESKDFLLNNRFYAWQSNFRDWNRFRESTTLLFIMLFPYLFLLRRKFLKETSSEMKMWCKIASVLIIINAMIIVTSGLISEVRLLFIPLLFIIPFLQAELKEISIILLSNLNRNIPWKSLILSGLIAFLWYQPKTQGTGYFYKIYVFIFLLIVFESILYKSYDQIGINDQMK